MSEIIEIVLMGKDELSGPIDHATESLGRMREHMLRIRDIALGNIIGDMAIRGVDGLARKMDEFGRGLITSNMDAQNLRQTLAAVYNDANKAQLAWNFIQANEVKVPFSEMEIATASANVARFGGNIVQVIPALESLASVFRSTLGPNPLRTAAQAWQDMHAGLDKMMKRDLGVTTEDLVGTGFVSLDKTKHMVGDMDKALAAFVSKRYPNAIADSMNTLSGVLSSLDTQWTRFQRAMGVQVFTQLQVGLTQFVTFLQGHQGEVQAFGTMIATTLGNASRAAVAFGTRAAPYIGSAVAFMARAWPILERAVSATMGFVGRAVAALGNWLTTTGFPAITKVINAVSAAWQDIAGPVQSVLRTLGDDFSTFAMGVAGIATPLMEGIAGAFKIGMGLVQIIFGGALDVLSGNWSKFQKDVSDGANLIAVGLVDMVAGASTAMLPLGNEMLKGLDALWHNQHEIITKVGTVFSLIAATAAAALWPLVASVQTVMRGVEEALKGAVSHTPKFLWEHLPGGHGMQIHDAIMGMTDVPIDSPMSLFKKTFASSQSLIDRFAPGDPSKNLHITAGMSIAQATADIEARRQKILKDIGLLNMSPGKATEFSTSGGPGADILAQFKGLFKDLGGKFSWSDFLKAMGVSVTGKGGLSFTGKQPGPLDLAIPGGPGGGDTAAALAGGAGGLLGGRNAISSRIGLGQLGAQFGQTMATTGLFKADQTAREMAKQSTYQDKLVTNSSSQLTVQQQMLAGISKMATAMATMAASATRATLPSAPPENRARAMGVARPGRL